MDTKTTQTNGSANKDSKAKNENGKWSRTAKVAGAAAAVAGVGGIAASLLSDDTAKAATDDMLAAASPDPTMDGTEAEVTSQAAPQPAQDESPAATAPDASRAHQERAAAPHHTSAERTTEQQAEAQQPVEAESEDIAGIPVDAKWLADNQQSTESTETNETNGTVSAHAETVPPLEQNVIEMLADATGDELVDKVNVSPEILMSMMGVKATDMLTTELNGDGMEHEAALLMTANGSYLLLVDSDGDGLLDMITDTEGNAYAALENGVHFEVDVTDMRAFVNTHQHDHESSDAPHEPMYALADNEIVDIDGGGSGDEIAYIDESDILSDSADAGLTGDEPVVLHDANLVETEIENDIAANDSDDEVDVDLLHFDDSSLA